MPPIGTGIGLLKSGALSVLAQAAADTAETTGASPIDKVADTLGVSTGDFLPGIVNAFIIGIIYMADKTYVESYSEQHFATYPSDEESDA